jgi:phage terminase Nu1 subunit (DNA packaging protein)
MKQAEQKAIMLEMERREMERDLMPAAEVQKTVGRVMQTIKNSFNNVPPKVRQAYQSASTASEAEQMMHDIIHEALEAATTQLQEMD